MRPSKPRLIARLSVAVLAFVSLTGVSRSQEATPAQAESVRPGDRWVYEVKDEITGLVKGQRTFVVTEVTAKEVAVRVTQNGTNNFNNSLVMDRSWNALASGPRKYTPNDGTGVQLPLKVGQTWKVALDDVNSSTGAIFKRTITSRVVGQESITTAVGTVDAYVIEKQFVTLNPKMPALKMTAESKLWFDANGNYPVKRTFAARRDGRLIEQDTYTLTEFTRKP